MDAEQIQFEDDQLIVADVARAVEERELTAYYQPILEVAERRVVGAEALVRYVMFDGTIIPAGLFVPSLDRTDTIIGLDWFMAEEACTFIQNSHHGGDDVALSLNFSMRHATTSNFAQNLMATLEWHEVTPGQVRIEFDGVALMAADDNVRAFVESVVGAGFAVVADNCAADKEGLSVLQEMGVNRVKLGRKFWSAQDDAEIAEFVKEIALRGMVVCAGGIESAEEEARLRSVGVTRMQGFYFAEPMDGDALEAYRFE